MSDTESRILHILVENYELSEEELRKKSTLEDNGIDSIILLEIQLDLEKEFGKKIPDGDILNTFQLSDLVAYIEKKGDAA